MSALIVDSRLVLAASDSLRAKDIVQILLACSVMHPLLDHFEHVPVHLDRIISQGRMMEDLFNIVHDLLDRHIWMLPCVQNAGGDELENLRCDIAGRFIEDVAEMVLAQHGMSWVAAVWVGPNFKLVSARGIDDC